MTSGSRIHHSASVVCRYGSFLVAVLLVACSADPATRKQQYMDSGNRYFAESKYDEAILEFKNAIAIDAKLGEAHKQLALALAKTGDVRGALDSTIRAADLLAKDVEAQLAAGSFLLAARKPEEALARADAALLVEPSNVSAHLLRGNALAGLSSFDEALKAIEEAIRLNPAQGSSFTNLGAVQFAHGRRTDAETAFKKAVELSPKSVDTHLALGNFYWATGQSEETERAFLGALQVQPDNGPANRAMAAFTIAVGRYKDAEPYLRRLADASQDGAGVFALTDYYLAAGRPKDAIARLEESRKKIDSPVLGQRLARAYAVAGDLQKSALLVDQVLAKNPGAVDAQLLKGQLLLKDGKRDQALEIVKKAASENPGSVEAQFALGQMLAAGGDTVGAETAFREVLRINPRASAAQLEIARLQLSTGRTAESLRTAETAAKNQPRNVVARLTLIRSLLASKDLSRAGREITALQSEQPNLADVHVQAGLLAMLKNDLPGARRAFERAQSLAPRSLEPVSGLIAVDLRGDDLTGARARLEKRVAQGETSLALSMLAARTYFALKDFAAGERTLRAAIDADPSNLQPYGMLGQLYVSQKKLDQALKEFGALASRQPKPVGALTMTGIIHQTRGDVSAARKQYEAALAIDPNAAVAANNLAWIYAESGENLDVALQLAQTATAAAPDVPEVMDTLGWVHYRKNDFHRAIPFFERSVEKAPESASYRYHLGLVYLKSGDEARGRAALRRALSASPDAATAAEIRRLLGQPSTPAGASPKG